MFSSIARKSCTMASRRAYTDASKAREAYKLNSKRNWLSDPSTYPVIIVLAGAVVLCTTFMGYKIMYCPDVRLTKSKSSVLRTWGGKEKDDDDDE